MHCPVLVRGLLAALLLLTGACQSREPDIAEPICGGRPYSADAEARVLNQLATGSAAGAPQLSLLAFEEVLGWGAGIGADKMEKLLSRLDKTGQFTPEDVADFRSLALIRLAMLNPDAAVDKEFDVAVSKAAIERIAETTPACYWVFAGAAWMFARWPLPSTDAKPEKILAIAEVWLDELEARGFPPASITQVRGMIESSRKAK